MGAQTALVVPVARLRAAPGTPLDSLHLLHFLRRRPRRWVPFHETSISEARFHAPGSADTSLIELLRGELLQRPGVIEEDDPALADALVIH